MKKILQKRPYYMIYKIIYFFSIVLYYIDIYIDICYILYIYIDIINSIIKFPEVILYTDYGQHQ